MVRTLWCFFFVCASMVARAQVSGVIKVQQGDQLIPVEGARAFIRNTTISATTDATGAFSLDGILPGFTELVVYKSGYQLFKSPIRIQEGKAAKLNLKLIASVPATKKSEGDMKSFLEEFLGTGEFLSQCKIQNPKAIVIEAGVPQKISFREPVVVENSGSGYRMTCYLAASGVEEPSVMKQLVIQFDTLIGRQAVQDEGWKKAREKLYFGSRQHFLWALANGQVREQGFRIVDEEKKHVTADSLVKSSKLPGYKKIVFNGVEEIQFRQLNGKTESEPSWMKASEPFDVSLMGIPLNDQALDITGAMQTGVASSFPTDYFPVARMTAMEKARILVSLLQEKIYIHTDKPYYYPGEVLWMKGYINAMVPEYRDSLSKVLHVELISPEGSVLLTRQMKIEEGFANGDFIFPDSLKRGNYFLRGYTNLARNFGDENLFVKNIPVMGITDRIMPKKVVASQSGKKVSIQFDKLSYKLREKMKVTIQVLDESGLPVAANCSIAITDATQVAEILTPTIENNFEFDSIPAKGVPAALAYPIETGISFSGQFLNDKNKKEKAELTAIQGKMLDIFNISTDDNGAFFETGFDFQDTMNFRIQGKNAKGKVYGKVELGKQEIPSMDFLPSATPVEVVKTNKQQRVISVYEVPLEAKVLDEVTISAKRLVASQFVTSHFGNPTRMISGADLFGPDLVGSLITTVPGLKLSTSGAGFTQVRTISLGRQGQYGSTAPPEPLVYVNEVYVGGGSNVATNMGPGAVEALSIIPVTQVDHVEVITTMNGVISVQKGFGLIAVFLKPGAGFRKSYDVFTIQGYYKPREFQAPNYDYKETDINLPDLRSTLYWNPKVKLSPTSETTLSFFASDLDGEYRMVVEGVTAKGEPFRAVSSVEVVDH